VEQEDDSLTVPDEELNQSYVNESSVQHNLTGSFNRSSTPVDDGVAKSSSRRVSLNASKGDTSVVSSTRFRI